MARTAICRTLRAVILMPRYSPTRNTTTMLYDVPEARDAVQQGIALSLQRNNPTLCLNQRNTSHIIGAAINRTLQLHRVMIDETELRNRCPLLRRYRTRRQ